MHILINLLGPSPTWGTLNFRRLDPRDSASGFDAVPDAQAPMGSLQKGRSSAYTLRRAVAFASATALAADLKVHWGYLPSESNPADKPSRWQRCSALLSTTQRNATQVSVRLDQPCDAFTAFLAHRAGAPLSLGGWWAPCSQIL